MHVHPCLISLLRHEEGERDTFQNFQGSLCCAGGFEMQNSRFLSVEMGDEEFEVPLS